MTDRPRFATAPAVAEPDALPPTATSVAPRLLEVAVLAHRQTPASLQGRLGALCAVRGPRLHIHVLCHGGFGLARDLTNRLMAHAAPETRHRVRIWQIGAADAANAFNQYVHTIWDGQAPAVFVDAACRVDAETLRTLDRALLAAPDRLAAAAVPAGHGEAAARRVALLSRGGLAAECFALSAPTLQTLRRRRIRLPLGAPDLAAALNAMIARGLDPRRTGADRACAPRPLRDSVMVCPDAVWQPTVPEVAKAGHATRWDAGAMAGAAWHALRAPAARCLDRPLRQAQQRLALAALASHFGQEQRWPEQLPRTHRELIDQWTARDGAAAAPGAAVASPPPSATAATAAIATPAATAARTGSATPRQRLASAFERWALRQLRRPRDWSPAAIDARLLFDAANPAGQAASHAHAAMPIHWRLRTA